MPDRPSDNQQLRLSIQRLARRIRHMQADDAVTEGQRTTLFQLHEHGPQSLGSLAALERVSPPSMNRTVNCLVTAGMITRETSLDDGRKVDIALSDAGRTFIDETRRRRDAWFTRGLETLTGEQRRLLREVTPILAELADL